MDLHEWDLLSDEGFIDLHEIDQENNFSPKFNPNTTVIDVNYFIEPQNKKKNSRVIPVPIKFDDGVKKIGEKSPEESAKPEIENHQETISQVFFKKLKENEFVDMKLDSPKSKNRGVLPQIDVGKEEKSSKSPSMEEIPDNWEDHNNNGGLNIWKYAMTGIGAFFSFGFAAATVSLIVLGNRHRERQNKHSKDQEIHFQIYTNDKSLNLKQVVQSATKA